MLLITIVPSSTALRPPRARRDRIQPGNVGLMAVRRHEHIHGTSIRHHFLSVQYPGDIAILLRGRIVSRPVDTINSHQGLIVEVVVGGSLPHCVSRRENAGIKVCINEDRSVEVIPGASQRAPFLDVIFNGCIGCEDLGIGNVHTVLVLESRVGALPGCNAATAAAKGESRLFDECRAKAIEKVGLARNHGVVEISIGKFANVQLDSSAGGLSRFLSLHTVSW